MARTLSGDGCFFGEDPRQRESHPHPGCPRHYVLRVKFVFGNFSFFCLLCLCGIWHQRFFREIFASLLQYACVCCGNGASGGDWCPELSGTHRSLRFIRINAETSAFERMFFLEVSACNTGRKLSCTIKSLLYLCTYEFSEVNDKRNFV